MEERDYDEAVSEGRLPRFYMLGDKQIEYLPFEVAKAIERVHCPICLDALRAGLLDSRNVVEERKDNMIAKGGHISRAHPDDYGDYKPQPQQLKRPAEVQLPLTSFFKKSTPSYPLAEAGASNLLEAGASNLIEAGASTTHPHVETESDINAHVEPSDQPTFVS
ncbi:hypothetical protein T492DRAFT_912118, partial [Pavlovales sp. CCMP2436]